MVHLVIPGQVLWSYGAGALVGVLGLIAIGRGGEWREARGLERLILFGPLCYAVPIAAFGTEHFTLNRSIASLVPAWMPWHVFWAYFVGTCFILAGLSLATRIRARLAASLLALTFFLFVALMDLPAWAHNPRDRIALALALRELAFSGGALALAAGLGEMMHARGARLQATVARYFVAVPVLFYSLEQFRHGDHVPGVPLAAVTPTWLFGHGLWTYVAAAAYAVTGTLLLLNLRTRLAAAWLGLTVLLVELAVYVPIGVVQRASLNNGLNYVMDTLMFGGAVLLLAGAMPGGRDGGAASAAAA